MSQQGDLEAALVSALTAIESEGAAVLADVHCFAGPFDASLRRRVRRLRMPAAAVGYLDQRGGQSPRWTVALISEGLRDADEGRLGSVDTVGVFELARLARARLDGGTLSSGDRLALVEERLVEADAHCAICQQVYAAERAIGAPTFNGVALCGADSVMAVTAGPIAAEAVTFAFPGVDGVYRHELGVRSRSIVWQGRLRSGSHEGINAIVVAIEAAVCDTGTYAMTDGTGRTFEHCVLECFEATGPRREDPSTGVVDQSCRLDFVQVDPT